MFNHQLTQALALERQQQLLRQAEHDRTARHARQARRAERAGRIWGTRGSARRSPVGIPHPGSVGDIAAPPVQVAPLSAPAAVAAWHHDHRAA